MNKFTKWMSGVSVLTGLIYILHTDSVKADFKRFKTSITESRQLFNQLIKQIKDAKKSSVNLKDALQRTNFNSVKNHLNQFNDRLQPEIKKIQATAQRIKKNDRN